MKKALANFPWKEALPRMVADILIVQGSAAFALAAAAAINLVQSPGANPSDMAAYARGFYFGRFLPLSLIFPAIFLANGIYSTTRGYQEKYKWWIVLRGACTATLTYLALNFALGRSDLIPRSAALLFFVLLSGSMIGVRFFKYWLWASDSNARPAGRPRVGDDNGWTLVVGGAGYIGSILCRKLLDSGRKVRVLDSLIYGDSAIRDLTGHSDFELCPGDCRNIQDVVRAMKDVQAVVHLAAVVGDPACDSHHQAALEINYAATRMLMEICKGHGVERLIFASSCSVYGSTDLLMDERSYVAPVSFYGLTKVNSENALLEGATDRFHPVILRLATVFGHSYRPRFDLVVNLLTARAYKKGVITIYNGEQWRPFIHVRDVAEGFMRALNSPLAAVSGQIFNLGDSKLNYSLTAVAEAIREQFPATRVENTVNSDTRNYRVSFDKIRRQLGFECAVGLDEGIRELKGTLEEGVIADHEDERYNNQRSLAKSGTLEIGNPLDSRIMAAFSSATAFGGR